MGALIEQPLRTLFQGVSRQPDTVRLPGQVEEAENVLFSVVTGGFEKRSGTDRITTITGLGSEDEAFVHAYERDELEQYFVIIKDGDLLVYDLEGNEQTVTFPNGKTYLNGNPSTDFAVTTVADVTFIANRTVTVAMTGASGSSVTIYGPAQRYADLPRLGAGIFDYLSSYDQNNDAKWDAGDTGCANGAIWKVEPQTADNYGYYYAKLERSGNNPWAWRETANPNFNNKFDAATMPHTLTRNEDGTFTFARAVWADRLVGDPDIVPDPEFVGRTIRDIVFFRDRLGIVADETIYFSKTGDYWNFFPDIATQVKETDPFGVTASSEKVNILYHATPFRKTLFATSSQSQFEVNASGVLTPSTAVIDESTSYKSSAICRPLVLGDSLYFAAEANQRGAVFAYYYDESTLSNTADDITKHCEGYVPAPIIQLSGDTATGTIVALSGEDRSRLYVYRYYWEGRIKAQSSWSFWSFGEGSHIHYAGFLKGYLYILIRRSNGSTYIERLRVICSPEHLDFTVHLDGRVLVEGTYDADTRRTTWELPEDYGSDVVALLTNDFPMGSRGRQLNLEQDPEDPKKFSARGDLSGGKVLFGRPYESYVILSKLYPREGEEERTVTAGRSQCRFISFDYQNAGYFEVHVTPRYRDTRVKKFTGRVIGSAENLIGAVPIPERGTMRTRVGSRSDTVTIKVSNPSYLPATITSAFWMGYFNETTRQEG